MRKILVILLVALLTIVAVTSVAAQDNSQFCDNIDGIVINDGLPGESLCGEDANYNYIADDWWPSEARPVEFIDNQHVLFGWQEVLGFYDQFIDNGGQGGKLWAVQNSKQPENFCLGTEGWSFKKASEPKSGYETCSQRGTYDEYFSEIKTSGIETLEEALNAHPLAARTVWFVLAPNEAPVAVDDGPYELGYQDILEVAGPGVLANDTDIDGDQLTARKVSDPANGLVVVNPNGSFTYTHTGAPGTDSFTYETLDGHFSSNVATVTINVGQPPAMNAPANWCSPDSNFSVDWYRPPYILLVQPTCPAGIIEVELMGNKAVYSGDFEVIWPQVMQYIGDKSVTLRFKGNGSGIAPEPTPIWVNTVPVAVSDQFLCKPDQVCEGNIVLNDIDPDVVAGLQVLTATLEAGPEAQLNLNADGSFEYAPVIGFRGEVAFSYKISDGLANSDVAAVVLYVGADPVMSASAPIWPYSQTTLNWTHQWSSDDQAVPALWYQIILVLWDEQTQQVQYVVDDPYNQLQGWYPAADLCKGVTCSLTIWSHLPYNGTYHWWILPWYGTEIGMGEWTGPAEFVLDAPQVHEPQVNTWHQNQEGRISLEVTTPGAVFVQVWIGQVKADGTVITNHLDWHQAGPSGPYSVYPDIVLPQGEYQVYIQPWSPAGFYHGGIADLGWFDGGVHTVN